MTMKVFGRLDLHVRALERDTDCRFCRRRSDPGEPGCIETRTAWIGERCERRILWNDGQYSAVPRCHAVDMVVGHQAGGAWHVLWHNDRLAWQALTDMTGHCAAPEIVAPAGSRADDQCDVLAGESRRLSHCWTDDIQR